MQIIASQFLLEHFGLERFTDASVFGALPQQAIRWLLENGLIRQFEQGEELFEAGQPGNSFHVILSGTVDYYKYHDHRYAFIRRYKTGEQIGFVSLIALHDRVGRAEFSEPGISLEINSDVYYDFHLSHPLEFGILMMNLAREMARALRDTNNIVVKKS